MLFVSDGSSCIFITGLDPSTQMWSSGVPLRYKIWDSGEATTSATNGAVSEPLVALHNDFGQFARDFPAGAAGGAGVAIICEIEGDNI